MAYLPCACLCAQKRQGFKRNSALLLAFVYATCINDAILTSKAELQHAQHNEAGN